MSLFVGQLSREMRTAELKDIFEEFGRLNRCEVKSGRRADYAFLTFDDERDAEDALHNLRGREFYGLKMNVEWAKGGKPRSSGSGCFECGEEGHYARDCPRKRYRSPRGRYDRSPPRRRYDYRSPSPRRGRYSYSPSPERSPRRYISPRRERDSRSPRRSMSPRRSVSRSPRRERDNRSPRSISPRRSHSPIKRSPSPVRRSHSPVPSGKENGVTSPDSNNLKRSLEEPSGEEPPEKRSKIE